MTVLRYFGRSKALTAALACTMIFGGCATSKKYRMAGGTSPPINFAIKVVQPPLAGTIHTVIYIGGPGSWKEKALWDEYVITIANNGKAPIELVEAHLYDIEGVGQSPGSDPWELEELNESKMERLAESGLGLAVGMLNVAAAGGLLATLSVYGSATALSALGALPIVVAGEMIAVQVIDRKNKEAVKTEFSRRVLAMPAVIPPGDSVSGCLFFPQSPGPKKLLISCRQEGEFKMLEFDLTTTPLARLHLSDESE